jgi:hypothetical protein
MKARRATGLRRLTTQSAHHHSPAICAFENSTENFRQLLDYLNTSLAAIVKLPDQASITVLHSLLVKMVKPTLLFTLLTAVSSSLAALPKHKIRGVNLGSLFIIEPWMSSDTWKSLGCDGAKSEWDCVASLGQEKADAAFQKHWDTFISGEDLDKMKDYGLNTVRIPVGYWFVEETIESGENWPRGGMKYLDKIVELAASRNISVIIDLHGAPGVQVANNAFTGHVSPSHPHHTQPN